MSVAVGNPRIVAAPASREANGVRRWALALAIVHAALAATAFALLGASFGFPGILREPASVAIEAFRANEATIRFGYYLFTLSAFLFVPIAVLARDAFGQGQRTLLTLAMFMGVLAGITQMLGFARWTILVPFIADLHSREAAADGTALALYDFANRYLGMTVGEHFGWLFQASWTALLGVAALRLGLPRWLGWTGVLVGVGMLVSSFEPFGVGADAVLALLNAVATTGAPFWLIALFAVLARRGR